MLPTRAAAAMLRARPVAELAKLRPIASRPFHQSQRLRFQPTSKMLTPIPKEQQSAHTVSQRLRSAAKGIPVEIYPLVAIMTCSLAFGIYSFVRPAVQDATLRLHRSRSH